MRPRGDLPSHPIGAARAYEGMSISLATLLAALVASSPAPAPAPSPSPPASHGPTAVVHMRDFAFVPAKIEIASGTTLTIVNDDSEAHTATALDKSFDSAGLDAHESWSHLFTKPGTYPYLCELHPYMKGVIVVRPASKGTS